MVVIMDVSVILVSYNEREYLDGAIKNCLDQDFDGDMEIIIGDDGSNDGSIDVIESLEKEYPNIVRHYVMERGEGPFIPSIRLSNLIKRGLELAKGKYITIISADDRMLSNQKISKAYSFLEKDHNKKYSGVFSDYIISFLDGEVLEMKAKFPAFRPLLLAKNYLHASTFVFRREVYTGGYLNDRFCDDVGLIYSIYCAGKVKHFDDVTFEYKKRKGSIMTLMDYTDVEVMEMALFQDIYNKNKYRFSSLSAYYVPLVSIFKQRKTIDKNKYKLILNDNKKYKNDFLSMIFDYDTHTLSDKLKLRMIICTAKVSSSVFGLLRRVLTKFYKRG